MKSYDYSQRKGVRTLTWDEVAQLASDLAEKLAQAEVEVIIGVARAGLIPATLVATGLRKEMYPVRVTRRVDDKVMFEAPVWRVPVTTEVAGRRVAIIDEIADSGETLSMVAAAALEEGAIDAVTVSLVSHTWASPTPQFAGLITDEFVIFPWHERVLIDGEWQPHPEIVAGIDAQQGHEPDAEQQRGTSS
jgi:uncharacterized protein